MYLSDFVSPNSEKYVLKQSAVNTELFYFSVSVFETPNVGASIYHKRVCEREYLPGVSSTQRELAMD